MNEIPTVREMYESYEHIEKVIQECRLEEYVDQIKWHTFSSMNEVSEAAQQIIQTYSKLTSSTIPDIIEAKVQSQRDYLKIGSKLYIFAREQARSELSLSNEDVVKTFARVEIGGAKYCTKENPFNPFI